MDRVRVIVTAAWDPAAEVFVATSDDVPGLVAEAPTPSALDAKLRRLIPELLELNAHQTVVPPGAGISLIIRSEDRSSTLRLHA